MERGLFGRQTELALVSRLLDAVPSGPAALILGGEAGIGKSTLWLEAWPKLEPVPTVCSRVVRTNPRRSSHSPPLGTS
jgi:hypothetical protein